ncbi:MAG TPA: DUF2950 domain-containing protein [Candidatus Acidoferrales bacterium]|nr:DUF2950 domain-containing protein [Candidatus Acidoferrales bacterium]
MNMNIPRAVRQILLACAVLAVLCGARSTGGTPVPAAKTFATPQEAAKAWAAACEQQDTAALVSLLGPESQDLINSGDDARDKARRERFAGMAKEAIDVRPDPAHTGRYLIYVGKQEWPMPIPIVQTKDGYEFDVAAGKAEIIVRRVGRNELSAIEFLREFVNAELEFAYSDLNQNGMRDYSQQIRSTPGKHDGLYWEAEEGQPESPLAAMIERVQDEGYQVPEKDQPFSYRGYVFRILKAQGPNAPDGAREYVVRGDMIGGFAMVAYPEEYGVTGVKTFVVNQSGVVRERDLGAQTKTIGAAMKMYNPGKAWNESPKEDSSEEAQP